MSGSYHAGKKTILRAQKLATEKGLDPCLWKSIAEVLPQVIGREGLQTVAYVKEIHRIRKVLG